MNHTPLFDISPESGDQQDDGTEPNGLENDTWPVPVTERLDVCHMLGTQHMYPIVTRYARKVTRSSPPQRAETPDAPDPLGTFSPPKIGNIEI